MVNNFKRLGATTVVASTDTQLYVVPASHEAIIKSMTICNIGGAARTYRVACVDAAIASVANEDYQFYGVSIAANSTTLVKPDWCLIATHTVMVWANHADVVFSCFGNELDV